MNMFMGWVILVVVVAIGIAGALFSSRYKESEDKPAKQ